MQSVLALKHEVALKMLGSYWIKGELCIDFEGGLLSRDGTSSGVTQIPIDYEASLFATPIAPRWCWE